MKKRKIKDSCYVIMESEMKKESADFTGNPTGGCKILLAQKAFSMYSCYPLIGEYLDGTTASGSVNKARERMYGQRKSYFFSGISGR